MKFLKNELVTTVYTTPIKFCQQIYVRCPGHAIHFMWFNYEEYVQRVVKLTGSSLSVEEVKKKYGDWLADRWYEWLLSRLWFFYGRYYDN